MGPGSQEILAFGGKFEFLRQRNWNIGIFFFCILEGSLELVLGKQYIFYKPWQICG